MVEASDRRKNLAVLRLSLARSAARYQLVFHIDVANRFVAQASVDVEVIGLPPHLEVDQQFFKASPEFTIPEGLVQTIQCATDGVIGVDIPLWIEFVPPYGNLPLVPWEELLQPLLNVPILRLPHFDLQPISFSNSLNIVFCVSLPGYRRAKAVATFIEATACRLINQLDEETTIHVFTDISTYYHLHSCFSKQTPASTTQHIRLYNPHKRTEQSSQLQAIENPTADGIDNPWFLWIKETLINQSVDVVHFFCQGYLGRNQGALTLADIFQTVFQQKTQLVGLPQLNQFLNQIGAWSVGFSMKGEHLPSAGIRLLVDELVHWRLGPVFLHNLNCDQDVEALAIAYRFLYSGGPHPPPNTSAISIYSHPNRLHHSREDINDAEALKALQLYTLAGSLSQDAFDQAETQPSWIASTQRYLEQRLVELLGNETTDSSQAHEGKKEALKLISTLCQRYASL